MALLQDLTVFGVTNLISDTYVNNIFSNGFHHNAHNNNDSVLLAGGGHKPIADFLPSTTVVNYVSQENSTTANWRGVILGYNSNASANTGISSTVSNVVYTTNNLTVQPSTGALSSKGRGTFVGVTSSSGFTSTSGDLIFNNVNHILWNSGSYHQRIFLTDDNTSGTAVFTFQQSANTGSTWTDLFTIKDNGTLLAGTNTVYHSGNYASHLYVGAANAAANGTESNPYLKLYNTLDSTDTLKEQYQLSGSNDIKVDSDATGNITFSNKGRTVYFVVGTSTTAGTWLGSHPDITEYYNGLTVLYYINKAGASTTTLNINDLGAITCYYGGTTKLSTHYAIGSIVLLTYYDNGWRRCEYYSDSNYLAGQYYSRYKVHAQGYIGRYMLVMKCPDGTITGLSTTNNSTGTSKVMFTGPLLLDQVFYMAGTGTWAAGANMATNLVLYENYSLVDVRYTFNCGSTLVAYKPFFIVLNKGNDGYYYLDTTQPWQIDIPTTDSEKIYLKIGSCYDTYRVAFEAVKKAYIRRDGIFTEFHDNSEKILVTHNLSNNSYALVFESTNNMYAKYSYLYKTIGDGDTDPDGAGSGSGHDGIYWNPYLKSFWFGENNEILSSSCSHIEGSSIISEDANYSHAEGYGSKTSHAIAAHAEGWCSYSMSAYSHAEGQETKTWAISSHAEGCRSVTRAWCAHAEGLQTQANGVVAHAEGLNTRAFGDFSHAEGQETHVKGIGAHGEGYASVTVGDFSHTEGHGTKTGDSGVSAHAEGHETKAMAWCAHAEGYYTEASGDCSHAEGNSTQVYGHGAHAEGLQTMGYGVNSHAEGGSSTSFLNSDLKLSGNANDTQYSLSLVNGSGSVIAQSHSIYSKTNIVPFDVISLHPNGHKITYIINCSDSNSGNLNSFIDNSFTVSSTLNTSNFSNSQLRIYKNVAFGESSHVEGYNCNAIGYSSHAEGQETRSVGDYSHAEGLGENYHGNLELSADIYYLPSGEMVEWFDGESNNMLYISGPDYGINPIQIIRYSGLNYVLASFPYNSGLSYGMTSHVEGNRCKAIGNSSHAEGNNTISYGSSSHAEGLHSIAVGGGSHAEGVSTVSYYMAHSEGYNTRALGIYSHTSGQYTISKHLGEFACGYCNLSTIAPEGSGNSGHTLFTIGNGTSSTRQNAVTVWSTGDMDVLGNISNSSDISRKHDIQDLGDDAITNLFATENGFIREFTWNESNKVSYGFIAQEIENYCPEAVSYDASGLKVVNYNAAFAKIIGSMYKKIKELENEIDILKNGNH